MDRIEIRPATPADSPACGRIIYQAFRGIADAHHFPPDFASADAATALLSAVAGNPALFGVVAECAGRIIGSNFLDRRDAIAGVGPITVDPAFQGRGAGRDLMQAVLDRGRGAVGIRLVQEPFNTVSLPLYASLGFEAREPLALMCGKPVGRPSGRSEARLMRESDLAACGQLCKRLHGWDRINELRDSLRMFQPFVLDRGGIVAAYMSAPTFWQLNHGVAETEQDLYDLLLGAAAANTQPISLLVPIRRAAVFRWCIAAGLRVVKPMTLMTIGPYNDPQGAFFPSVVY